MEEAVETVGDRHLEDLSLLGDILFMGVITLGFGWCHSYSLLCILT